MDSAVTGDHAPPTVEAHATGTADLTPEQRRIKELEDLLAKELGRKDPEPVLSAASKPGDSDNILIHMLEDGLTAFGTVWYRGQELEIEPGSDRWRETCDRTGRSWLDLRDNEFGQVERWGKVMFRSGPWPGKTLMDAVSVPFQKLKNADGTPVAAPGEAEFEAAMRKERMRNRAVPSLPMS